MTSVRTYFDTIRYLRARQIMGRMAFRMQRPAPDLRPAPPVRALGGTWKPGPPRKPSMLEPNRVRILNVESDISSPSAWENPGQSRLWLYNLHYCDDLNAQDAALRLPWHQRLVTRWHNENPPGQGTGWEPYPLSLRIVNWIKWHLSQAKLDQAAVQSLAVQARFLSRRLEHHILGNHLLANAKALIFAGIFFEGAEAGSWRALGTGLLEREIGEQVLADGGHFELSPMYHNLVLLDLLDVFNLCALSGFEPPTGLERALSAMLAWSQIMYHPDGDIPFFNDAAFGIAPKPAELVNYAGALGVEVAATPDPLPLMHLAATGYARLTAGAAVLFADMAAVGPDYLPGHAHADTLGFELSLGGQRMIVNGGTSVYGVGADRACQRATRSHSTLVLDGSNSSEVWGGFRVGRRARIHDARTQSGDPVRAQASHDGYRFLNGRPRHHRLWELGAGGLLVADRVTGRGEHKIELFFHLHPAIEVSGVGNALDLRTPDGMTMRFLPPQDMDCRVLEQAWHPEFGVAFPSRSIRCAARAHLPATLETRMTWQAGEAH